MKKEDASTKRIAIFDFDGVIVNPVFRLHVLKELFSELKEERPSPIPAPVITKMIAQLDQKIASLGKRIVDENMTKISRELLVGADSGDDYLDTIKKRLKPALKLAKYQKIIQENTRILPSGLELVQAYKDKGFKTALITNQDHATAVGQLEHLDIKKYFDNVQGNTGRGSKVDGFETPRKPDPKVTTDTLEKLGVSPDATILFHGDSIKDLLLNPDRNEGRGISNSKFINIRKGGVTVYKNFKVILLNEQPGQNIVESFTPTEYIDYREAIKEKGRLGQSLGYYANSSELLKKFDQEIDLELSNNRLSKAYEEAIIDHHDGDLPIHLHPDYTLLSDRQNSIFFEQYARATSKLRGDSVSYRDAVSYAPQRMAFDYTATEVLMGLQFEDEKNYLELVNTIYDDHIAEATRSVERQLLKDRDENARIAYDILSDYKNGKSLQGYPAHLKELVIALVERVQERAKNGSIYKSENYAGTAIKDHSSLIIAQKAAN